MINNKYLPLVYLFSLMLIACVKPYNPDIDKYERILVINGLLTNSDERPYVELSFSYQVNQHRPEMAVGAQVSIENEAGDSYMLEEVAWGKHRYNGNDFTAKIGEKYRVRVSYDEHQYLSDFTEMTSVSEVESLSFATPAEDKFSGVNVFLSSNGSLSDSRYYAWSYTETWKFRVPLPSSSYSTKQLCWATEKSAGINIGTTEQFSDNSLKGHKLYFISADESKLYIRYSSLVRQYSITRETYQYLQHVQSVNENNGSLFDPIPASMSGNVYCDDDLNVPVIGNFQVSAVSEKRFFIDRTELDGDMYISAGLDECRGNTATLGDTNKQDSLKSEGYVIMDTATIEQVTYVRYASQKYCFDCTASGAPNTAPEWWTEKE